METYKKSNPESVVIIDSPLLIESENYKNVDKVILIKCSMDLQIRRVMGRNGKSRDDVINRLKSQMPLEEKVKYTDYIVNNDDIIIIAQIEHFNAIENLEEITGRSVVMKTADWRKFDQKVYISNMCKKSP